MGQICIRYQMVKIILFLDGSEEFKKDSNEHSNSSTAFTTRSLYQKTIFEKPFFFSLLNSQSNACARKTCDAQWSQNSACWFHVQTASRLSTATVSEFRSGRGGQCSCPGARARCRLFKETRSVPARLDILWLFTLLSAKSGFC